jgi:hypothetical protein
VGLLRKIQLGKHGEKRSGVTLVSYAGQASHVNGVGRQAYMSEVRKQGSREASDDFYKFRRGENFDFSKGF